MAFKVLRELRGSKNNQPVAFDEFSGDDFSSVNCTATQRRSAPHGIISIQKAEPPSLIQTEGDGVDAGSQQLGRDNNSFRPQFSESNASCDASTNSARVRDLYKTPCHDESIASYRESRLSGLAALRKQLGRDVSGGGGVLSISDLVDNECAQILQTTGRVGSKEFENDSAVSAQSIDWKNQLNRDKLGWTRKLARQLFQAFKEEPSTQKVVEVPVKTTNRQMVGRLLANKYITALSLIFTVYALCAADISALAGSKAKHTLELACANTVVLLYFTLESILHIIGVQGYLKSPQFFVDTFALMSMVGDTWIGYEVLKQDGAASGRAARVLRMLRMGGRSSRFARMVKNARLVQALRIMPRLWHVLNTQRQELRIMLFHERLFRLFQCLDEGDKQYLENDEAQIYLMALDLEFPSEEARKQTQEREEGTELDACMRFNSELSRDSHASESAMRRVSSNWVFRARTDASVIVADKGRCQMFQDKVKCVASKLSSACSRTKMQSKINPVETHVPAGKATFESMLQAISHMGTTERILAACEKDLQRVETSFNLVHEAGGRLTLKVSTLVLIVLILLPMLEVEHRDKTEEQLLYQMHFMVALTGPLRNCSIVRDYAQKTKHKLILLAVNMTAYWTPDCQCCMDCCRTAVASVIALSQDLEEWSGRQPHELMRYCYPGGGSGKCRESDGEQRSLALFDISEAIRYEASMSLLYTSVVIILLLTFVFFFTSDLRIFNERVLNPLWDLLDDMAAMKTVEFAASKDLTQLGQELRSVTMTQYMSRQHLTMHRIRQFFRRCATKAPNLEEMEVLGDSFGHFRTTLRSWTKYVPIALVKKIVQSGIEVQLGVTRREVTVFFLDINGFDDLCKGLEPREVLILLSGILQEVTRVLDTFQGTLLEFIGDEMLAVFNAPTPVHRHTNKGVSAAAACLDRLARLQSMSLRARIGVNTATVLCGNLGSPMRLKYGMLGDGVNMTARLKSLNSQLGTRCLTNGATLDSARADDIVRRPLGLYILKGKTTPTDVWEVLGTKDTLPDVLQRAAQQHTKGFDHFLQRRFKEARACFAEVYWSLENVRNRENDQPSRHLLRRCDEYMKNPPPDDWDGSEKLSKK